MAGNLPVPNAVQLKIVWNLNGVPSALNILNWANPQNNIVNQAAADAVDTGVKAGFTASGLAAQLYSGVSLARIELRNLASNSNPWFVGAGAAVPGTSASNPLPAATSFVISIPTGLRGRSFNGRYYQWGFTEDANDVNGGCTVAASTATRDFLNQVGGVMGAVPRAWTIGVLSRFTTAPGSTTPIERNPPLLTVASGIVVKDQRWDVQRRRAIPGI